ncbi:MAG: AraC family transcriptional regulator [Pseudomonadota bacterium]
MTTHGAQGQLSTLFGQQQVETPSGLVDYVHQNTPGYDISLATTQTILLINLAPSGTEIAVNSDRLRHIDMPKSSAVFVPVGTGIHEICPPGQGEFILLHVSDKLIAHHADHLSGGHMADEYRRDVSDLALGRIGEEVRRSLVSGQPEGAAYIDSLMIAFWQPHQHLLAQTAPASAVGSALAPGERDGLLAFIDANLAEPLGLLDLAQQLELPVSRLQVALKETFGAPLHQLLLDLRIARARALLADTDNTIADVAYACGFSSQQHMTNSFTSKLGTSPGRYRRLVRS